MKKRIYAHFMALILAVVVLLSFTMAIHYQNVLEARERKSVSDAASMTAQLLNMGFSGNVSDYFGGGPIRMTIIAPDGSVLLDNATDASDMENHLDRLEVAGALASGVGEATRHSETLSADTYYYALRLENGNILRLSKTVDNIGAVFADSLPVVIIVTALVLLLANFLARNLTARVIRPLESIDFDGENVSAFEELHPYMRKIETQKREIAVQIAALKERADTIEAITENMKEGLLLLDPAAAVLTANKSAMSIFGETGIVHRNILHICRDTEFSQCVRQCLSGKNAELLFERGGRVYGVYFSPVSTGGASGAVVLFLDITERQEAEKQRREFSANVSHELKTPLTSISALSEMIANGMVKDEDIKGFAGRISEQAGRLMNIIEDIIRLSEFDEADAKKAQKELAEFNLMDLAQSVINSLPENECGVQVKLAGESFKVKANRRMIDELLCNLIDNAIKYNKENGEVAVTLTREGGFCKIAVADTGMGIPEEHHSRVFERFYRVDKSRSKKTGGTGLGLSIVKHIAAYHGGRAELASTPGVGTTVTCTIAM